MPRSTSRQKPTKPSRRPAVARSLAALRTNLEQLRRRGARVALIPTMGALHDGHVSLVRLARKHAERVVVSIFVNPTQFAAHEDLGSYPRTFDADLEKLAAEGVELVWAPTASVMYPEGFATRVAPEGPALAGLEDRFRPHFFGGVATVVAKLFTQCRPDIAIFGEKDFQQLKVVTQMSRDLDLGVKVIGAPIRRERDGLAMSSRNVYLSTDERQTATVLNRTLKDASRRLRAGEAIKKVLADGAAQISSAGFALDYFELRDAETLAPLDALTAKPARLLVAAKIGTTRLIDNFRV